MTAAYDPRHDWAVEDRENDQAVGAELVAVIAPVNPILASKLHALFAVSDYEAF